MGLEHPKTSLTRSLLLGFWCPWRLHPGSRTAFWNKTIMPRHNIPKILQNAEFDRFSPRVLIGWFMCVLWGPIYYLWIDVLSTKRGARLKCFIDYKIMPTPHSWLRRTFKRSLKTSMQVDLPISTKIWRHHICSYCKSAGHQSGQKIGLSVADPDPRERGGGANTSTQRF